MKRTFLLIVLISSVSCSLNNSKYDILFSDSRKIIESNLYFLASDELEGREAGQAGEKIASQFISNQLKQYGVKPFGENGTYFQNFPLQKTKILPESKMIVADTSGEKILTLGENYIPFETGEEIFSGELVFVGYGISDSTMNYDDYADVDVSGKTVVCMYGVPRKKDDPNYFKEGMRWAGSTRKVDCALKKGAAAVLIIQSEYWINNWDKLGADYVTGKIGKDRAGKKINAAWIDTLTVKYYFLVINSHSALSGIPLIMVMWLPDQS
jgi:hypothetical protein